MAKQKKTKPTITDPTQRPAHHFKPGNQLAVGHGCGRPSKYDLDKEAADLDEWSKREDARSLFEFTFDKDYLAQELTDFAHRSEVFRLALNKAKERISSNREKLVSKGLLHATAWNRSASLYDRPLYHHEEEIKDRQSERDKGVAKSGAENFVSLLAQLKGDDIKQD